MNEEKIRKIIISDKTLAKMKKDLIEQLQKEEKVEIVVVPAGSIHDQKVLRGIANTTPCLVITSPQEETTASIDAENTIYELIKQREEENADILEKIKDSCEELMKNIEVIQPAPQSEKYNNPRKKYNVPRTIGRPNSMKKGRR